MKKTLIALAALSAIAGAAQAQSTVTLYGLLDVGFGSFTTNQVVGTTIKSMSQTKIDPASFNGNRWGLKGSEDLGGGLSAIFNLESGFNIDTGASAQGGLLFGRRANVGLAGGFGKVELGRNSSSYDDVAGDHAMMAQSWFDPSNLNNGLSTNDAAAVGTLAGAQKFLSRTQTWVGYNTRFNNSVKYTSPNFGGFSGSFMYALGEDKNTPVAGADASKSISANLKYANGPLVVSGGYQSEALGGTQGNASTVTASVSPALENALLSASYDFGVAKVGAGISRAKYKDVTAPAALGGGDFAAQNEYNLSVAVPFGATTLSAGYAVSSGDTLGKSTGFGVQATYDLSKRTMLYAGGVSTKTYDKLADAVAASTVGSDIARNTTYAIGIRHKF